MPSPWVKTNMSSVNDEILGEEKIYTASQWELMWLKFRQHRLAKVSGVILLMIYIMACFCEFFSPCDPFEYDVNYAYAPPQVLRLVADEGSVPRLAVYGWDIERDLVTFRRKYTPNKEKVIPIKFFVRGHSYKVLGLWETDLHLFGAEGGKVFLFGTDRMGRDLLSRVLYGARISTSIGLVGVFLSLLLGITIGAFSGYYGGVVDNVTQRVIELLRCIPTIPLWMALSAALPPHWPAIRVYLGITIILSLIGWTGLARVVRSKFLSLREEDFVMAARLCGCSEGRIVLRHMVPSFASHIIAQVTLSIPGMILGETSLSFLGLGLRPPSISWGVLLQEAQNIRSVAHAPWLFLPGMFVIVTVLAFNFLGDGMRDALDPYVK